MNKGIWIVGIIVSTFGYGMISISLGFFPSILMLILFVFTEYWFFSEYEKSIRREYHA